MELRLAEPATPDRVEAAARMFKVMLETVRPDLPADSVTMVVTNRKMSTGLRAWTPEARAATKTLLAFVRTPVGYLKKHPEQLQLAVAVGEFTKAARAQGGVEVWREGQKKATARLDEAFTEKIDRYRESVDQSGAAALVTATTTTVRSVVLRVGRLAEGKPVCARVTIRGDAHDLRVKGDAGPFFAAAQDGGIHRITVKIAWKRDAGGARRIDAERSHALALERLAPALRGEALLDALSEAMPSLVNMSDEEVQARLAESRGGR